MRLPRPTLSFIVFAGLTAVVSLGDASVVDVTSSTVGWTPIVYSAGNSDPSNDQQTGSSEGDIVGNSSHPALYTEFGDAGTPSLTDGTLAFRARVGADVNPAGFKTALFVGIDANNDGALDLFLGINNSGSSNTVGIWNPGAGANTSPNTTTIVSTPLVSYLITAANYNWMAVNLTNDPSVGTATDIDGGGQNDYFLTFSIPLADLITQLNAKGITGINENSIFHYVMATATQANSLNQDLNGVGKNYDPNLTWSQLGAFADPITASGVVVPEANTVWPAAILLLVAITWQRRSQGRAPMAVSRLPALKE